MQYKKAGGIWLNWVRRHAKTSRRFTKGKVGQTIYFRARAKNPGGVVGKWSPRKKTVIPYDNDSFVKRRRGFGSTYSSAASRFYLGTLRYSSRRGNSITYRFKGSRFSLVGTRAKNRSKAKVYVDGVHVQTINAYSKTIKYRGTLFTKRWGRSATHTVKIVNLATRGRKLFDVDGIAIEK